MCLRSSHQQRRHEGRSAGSTDVSRKIGQAGDVVVLVLLHTHIGDRVDWNEEKGQTGGLEDAHEHQLAIADTQVDLRHVQQADGEIEEAEGNQLARVHLAGKKADHRHHGHHHEAGRREHKPGKLRGIPQQRLDELRNQDGRAVQGEAQHKHQDEGDREGPSGEQGQVQQGAIAVPQLLDLPPDQGHKGNHHHDRKKGNQVRSEPVILLAFIQNELQGAKGQADQAKAQQVQLDAALFRLRDFFLNIWRIFHDPVGQEEGQQADRHVKKEDPAPIEVVGDVATQRRADRRGDDHRQAIHGEGLPALLRGKGIRQDGLFTGRKTAAAHALQDPAEDQNRQTRRQSTQRGRETEQRHADHVKLLPPNERGHVGAGRQNDGVRDQVRRQDPGGFVLRGAKAARDVRQSHIRDGGIEHLHKRRQRHRHGNNPRVDRRSPRLGRRRGERGCGQIGGCGGCHRILPCQIPGDRKRIQKCRFSFELVQRIAFAVPCASGLPDGHSGEVLGFCFADLPRMPKRRDGGAR